MLLRKIISPTKKVIIAAVCFLLITSTLLSTSAMAANKEPDYSLDYSFYEDVQKPAKMATTKNEARRLVRWMYYNHQTTFTAELKTYKSNGKTVKIEELYGKAYRKGDAAALKELATKFINTVNSSFLFARRELYEYTSYCDKTSFAFHYDTKTNKLYCTYKIKYKSEYKSLNGLTVFEQQDASFAECEKIALSLYKTGTITKESSAQEKTKAVYDYICKNFKYDEKYKNQTPYLMLKNKSGTCGAFAGVFAYTCKLLGVRVVTEYGYPKIGDTSQPHCWNKLEYNNKYVFFDVTWGTSAYNSKHKENAYNYFWQSQEVFYKTYRTV